MNRLVVGLNPTRATILEYDGHDDCEDCNFHMFWLLGDYYCNCNIAPVVQTRTDVWQDQSTKAKRSASSFSGTFMDYHVVFQKHVLVCKCSSVSRTSAFQVGSHWFKSLKGHHLISPVDEIGKHSEFKIHRL